MKTAIYPGSFDPITRGHVDIIGRAARLCDTLVVVVMKNVHKQGAFTVNERLDMIERACAGIKNVRICAWEGLLVECARVHKADAVVRGLRAANDFEYEFQMAQLNRRLYAQAETLFIMTSPEYAYISSSAVREIASFGGDVSALVPETILEDVKRRFLSVQ